MTSLFAICVHRAGWGWLAATWDRGVNDRLQQIEQACANQLQVRWPSIHPSIHPFIHPHSYAHCGGK